jgi:ankyrin repeat protein
MQLFLKQQRIDINAIASETERTALHFAVISDSLQTFKLLVDGKGIDLDLEDNDGKTALFYALENNEKDPNECNQEIKETLSQYGVEA